jgi:hypothetical protein
MRSLTLLPSAANATEADFNSSETDKQEPSPTPRQVTMAWRQELILTQWQPFLCGKLPHMLIRAEVVCFQLPGFLYRE